MSLFSKFNIKSTLTSFMVLSTFLSTCDLEAGKRKREEEKDTVTSSLSTKQSRVENEDQVSYFDLLPDELTLSIFSHLKIEDMPAVAGTCQTWYGLAGDDFLWKELLNNTTSFPEGFNLPEGQTYRETLKSMVPLPSFSMFAPHLPPFCQEIFNILPTPSDGLRIFSMRQKGGKVMQHESTRHKNIAESFRLDDTMSMGGRNRRQLMLTVPGSSTRRNILNELLQKLYPSLGLSESFEEFEARVYNDPACDDHDHNGAYLRIHGMSPNGDLLYGSVLGNNHLFVYNTLTKNVFLRKDFLKENTSFFHGSRPLIHKVSDDGLTLLGKTIDSFFRWKLQTNAKGDVISDEMNSISNKNKGVTSASADGSMIGMASQTEAFLWADDFLVPVWGLFGAVTSDGFADSLSKKFGPYIKESSSNLITNILASGNMLTIYGKVVIENNSQIKIFGRPAGPQYHWKASFGKKQLNRMIKEWGSKMLTESELANLMEGILTEGDLAFLRDVKLD